MKYIALNGFCLGGGVDAAPGQILELDERNGLVRGFLWSRHIRPATAEEIAAHEAAAKPASEGEPEGKPEGEPDGEPDGEGDTHPEAGAEHVAAQDEDPNNREPRAARPRRNRS